MGLYYVPVVGTDEDLAVATVALWLGLPTLVGAIVRSPTVGIVAVLVGVLLVLTYFLGLGGDNVFWSDPFAVPTIVILTVVEVGCAALGISLGRRSVAQL